MGTGRVGEPQTDTGHGILVRSEDSLSFYFPHISQLKEVNLVVSLRATTLTH